jgi:hypothetical protein
MYLEPLKSLLQSCVTLLKQGVHLILAKNLLDFVSVLRLNKCMDLVHCSVQIFGVRILQ